MLIDFFKNILRFITLILLQVLIVKNIELGPYIVPFIYVLFIIMLPFNIQKMLLLLIAFICGLTVDVFYSTIGMHAAACVFVAYIRPGILKLISPRDGYDSNMEPTMQYMGTTWFLTYSLFMVLAHHFILFYIEVFRWSDFFSTFLRVLLSTIATMILIIVTQFLFYKRKSDR